MQSGAIRPLNNMLPRNLFNAEHEAFRETVRKFYAKEVVPNIEKYEQQQHVDRELWNKAGAMGLLCATMPEAYGGSGVDRLYSMILGGVSKSMLKKSRLNFDKIEKCK